MSEPMTPAEAADWVENSGPIHVTAKAAAVRVLIDHARSTTAASDLTAGIVSDDEVSHLRAAISALDWADLTETIAEHTREIATIRTLVEKLIGGAS